MLDMTQEAITLRTSGGAYPGLEVVQDVNKANETIATDFAGPADPAALAVAYSKWADTTNMLLKRRNAANSTWVTLGGLFDKAVNLEQVDALFPFRGIKAYDAAGTFTWAVPADVTKAWVIVTAGGGGGGIGNGSLTRGAGGGAGGTAMKLVPLLGISSVTVTVGNGGGYGSPTGGSSSFGVYLTATGGAGGENYSGAAAAGGDPGVGINGDVNISGGWGSDAPLIGGQPYSGSGDGGASYFGGGSRSSSGALGADAAPGGGAGGRESSTMSGSPGIVIIKW